MSVQISVVMATRGRGDSAARLIGQFADQTLPPEDFEVIVVDDGSPTPVAERLTACVTRYSLRCERIAWSGPAAARHHGAQRATGRILVFIDDDMQVGPSFLAHHLDYHQAASRAVVLGRIDPDPNLARMPLFERYHARQLARWQEAVNGGALAPRGLHLCTGNVSMRRADYFAVGGFNSSLERSEDRELGIRLEAAGCLVVYADEAVSIHSSDHTSVAVWLKRAVTYGRVDRRIALMHPAAGAHPWRFWPLIHPLSRPVVAAGLAAPWLGRWLARGFFGIGVTADRLGATGLAVTLSAVSYALAYYAGLRLECGSLSQLRREIRDERDAPPRGPLRDCLSAIRADHNTLRQLRLKYHGDVIRAAQLPVDLISRIGFQMMACYRVMRLLRAWRVPLLPKLASRLIRHVYGAEIHWDACLAPGVSIVHGNGLVLSHAAEVGPGCILFQNVTLGESIDANTGMIGAPRLGANVHVGPGATLLGPITVGADSKIAASVVLMESVPASSLVMPPRAEVSQRLARPGRLRTAVA